VYSRTRALSKETARRIDAEVQRIINESHEAAKRLLQQHRDALDALDALVAALLARETLDEQEIREVTGLSLALIAIAARCCRAGNERPSDGISSERRLISMHSAR
jgi:hypothetical protein